jgi:hypothetical protein
VEPTPRGLGENDESKVGFIMGCGYDVEEVCEGHMFFEVAIYVVMQ